MIWIQFKQSEHRDWNSAAKNIRPEPGALEFQNEARICRRHGNNVWNVEKWSHQGSELIQVLLQHCGNSRQPSQNKLESAMAGPEFLQRSLRHRTFWHYLSYRRSREFGGITGLPSKTQWQPMRQVHRSPPLSTQSSQSLLPAITNFSHRMLNRMAAAISPQPEVTGTLMLVSAQRKALVWISLTITTRLQAMGVLRALWTAYQHRMIGIDPPTNTTLAGTTISNSTYPGYPKWARSDWRDV